MQCANHWNKTTTSATKSSANLIRMGITYVIGKSKVQLVENDKEEYMKELGTKKHFTVGEWGISMGKHFGSGEVSKISKINSWGDYTSYSNQDTSEANCAREHRFARWSEAKKEKQHHNVVHIHWLNESVVQSHNLT